MERWSSPPPSSRYAAIHLPRYGDIDLARPFVLRGGGKTGIIGKLSAGVRVELAAGLGLDGRAGAD